MGKYKTITGLCENSLQKLEDGEKPSSVIESLGSNLVTEASALQKEKIKAITHYFQVVRGTFKYGFRKSTKDKLLSRIKADDELSLRQKHFLYDYLEDSTPINMFTDEGRLKLDGIHRTMKEAHEDRHLQVSEEGYLKVFQVFIDHLEECYSESQREWKENAKNLLEDMKEAFNTASDQSELDPILVEIFPNKVVKYGKGLLEG